MSIKYTTISVTSKRNNYFSGRQRLPGTLSTSRMYYLALYTYMTGGLLNPNKLFFTRDRTFELIHLRRERKQKTKTENKKQKKKNEKKKNEKKKKRKFKKHKKKHTKSEESRWNKLIQTAGPANPCGVASPQLRHKLQPPPAAD